MNDLSISARAAVLKLQAAMLRLPQAELETKHFFADGMYCRWLFRKKGTLIVGKVHKREHFYLVIQGEVKVAGGPEGPIALKAPSIIVSAPGTKRAVFALEDSVCVTIHRTHSTDIEDIERELIEEEPLARFNAMNQLLENLT